MEVVVTTAAVELPARQALGFQPGRHEHGAIHDHLPDEVFGFGFILEDLGDKPPMRLVEHLIIHAELGEFFPDLFDGGILGHNIVLNQIIGRAQLMSPPASRNIEPSSGNANGQGIMVSAGKVQMIVAKVQSGRGLAVEKIQTRHLDGAR